MRERFETAAHLADEAEVRHKIERVFACVCRKCPEQYRVDFAMLNEENRIERFAEVKCRGFAHDPFWLSLAKWIALVELGEVAPKPSLIIVQWRDLPLMGYTVPRIRQRMPLVWGGRARPRDDQDSEPLVAIPVDRFQPMED